VFGQNQGSRDAAVEMIMAITAEAEVGAIYTGKVARIVDFGAFITILPGKDGLLHISQIANERVENVSDYLTEGQDVTVKCLDVDQRGRIKLSIKELLEDEAEQAPAAEVADESPAEAVAVESDAVESDAVELEVESEETEVSSEAVVESGDEASEANDGTESEDDETK
jgi:polyribonucleotide nucleotidyltransferase